MESPLLEFANRTIATQFVFNLFLFLLAGLAAAVWLIQRRKELPAWLPGAGFLLIALQFGVAAFFFAHNLFHPLQLEWALLDRWLHAGFILGVLMVSAPGWKQRDSLHLTVLLATVVALAIADSGSFPTQAIMDAMGVIALATGIATLLRAQPEIWRIQVVSRAFTILALVVHGAAGLRLGFHETLLWNVEQYALAAAFITFAWSAGELSGRLTARIFVRLNLLFMVFAAVMMLLTVGTEKQQYLQLLPHSQPGQILRLDAAGRAAVDTANRYVGRSLIMILSLLTAVVALSTGVVGIVVRDAERRLRRQFRELTETHQQLAKAAELASIAELAGGVAHEINTPVTSILSLASHLAGKDGELSPRERQGLQLIEEQAGRVSRTIGNLLTFARRTRLCLSPTPVCEFVDAAIQLLQYRLRNRSIKLQCDLPPDLPAVLGDSGRLSEVFVNLINNAIDAMPEGGTLAIRAESDGLAPSPAGCMVTITVADTGCGIAPEDLQQIFEPFFTTKPPGRGTGLGLSITHGIIRDHAGRVWATSTLGMGTTMIVRLPAAGPAAQTDMPSTPPREAGECLEEISA